MRVLCVCDACAPTARSGVVHLVLLILCRLLRLKLRLRLERRLVRIDVVVVLTFNCRFFFFAGKISADGPAPGRVQEGGWTRAGHDGYTRSRPT